MPKRITVAVSGASGAPYALSLIHSLLQHDIDLYLLISDAAREVFKIESGIELPQDSEEVRSFFTRQQQCRARLHYFTRRDWMAPVASGSNAPDAMVICPCSMGTLSAISQGASNNLIERAADVMLKERRQLIIVPRETPLSSIHLENMLKLSRMGVMIMPASPGFYHQPQKLDDIIAFMTARILSQLGLPHMLLKPWGS